jgi:hypothetical protein
MKLVLCEGKDDIAVVEGLCRHENISDLAMEQYGGRDNLERVVGGLHVRSEFTRGDVKSLAILIDADANADASFQKLQNAIRRGFDIVIPAAGVFVGESPRVAGFVICDGTGRGMLEDLCLKSVSGRADYKCMEEYFKCLGDKTSRKEYHSKAKFKAWMASQTAFDYRVGLAAAKGYIPWDSAVFNELRELLGNL